MKINSFPPKIWFCVCEGIFMRKKEKILLKYLFEIV